MFKLMIFVKRLGPEAFIWTAALLFLAFTYPDGEEHFSFCVFKFLGFDHCPGCGLGHSISYLLHGEFARSLAAHWLGGFALVVLVLRIISLVRNALSRTYPESMKETIN